MPLANADAAQQPSIPKHERKIMLPSNFMSHSAKESLDGVAEATIKTQSEYASMIQAFLSENSYKDPFS